MKIARNKHGSLVARITKADMIAYGAPKEDAVAGVITVDKGGVTAYSRSIDYAPGSREMDRAIHRIEEAIFAQYPQYRFKPRGLKKNPRRKSASSKKNPSTRTLNPREIATRYKFCVEFSADEKKWNEYGAFTVREVAEDVAKTLAENYPTVYIRVTEKSQK